MICPHIQTFEKHPLEEYYPYPTPSPGVDNTTENVTMPTLEEFEDEMVAKPNTALFTLILCLGTYMIAASFKDLKTSHYFGKTVCPS